MKELGKEVDEQVLVAIARVRYQTQEQPKYQTYYLARAQLSSQVFRIVDVQILTQAQDYLKLNSYERIR